MGKVVDIKFSTHLKAIESRLRRLPKLVEGAFDSSIKKDILNVIKEFKSGIKNNNFKVEQLTENTIMQKEAAGMPRPRTPLYGEGESQKNSLINALAFRKIKNGYRLYVRRAKHYKADLTLKVLLAIHENGAIIKNGFGKGIYIRIPPRPILDKAIIRALKKKKAGEPAASIKKAINELINTGKDNMFKKLSKFEEKEESIET